MDTPWKFLPDGRVINARNRAIAQFVDRLAGKHAVDRVNGVDKPPRALGSEMEAAIEEWARAADEGRGVKEPRERVLTLYRELKRQRVPVET